MPNILICDDERSICEMLDISLRREGYKVETVNSGEAGKKKLDSALFDIVITDIKMPNISGIEVLRHAHKVSPESAVILITAVDDYEAAVEAVKAGGATDYIRKSPAMVDEIKLAIRRALETVPLADGRPHRVLRIQDTLSLEKVEVSESYAEDLKPRTDLESLGPAREMSFDAQGNLPPIGA